MTAVPVFGQVDAVILQQVDTGERPDQRDIFKADSTGEQLEVGDVSVQLLESDHVCAGVIFGFKAGHIQREQKGIEIDIVDGGLPAHILFEHGGQVPFKPPGNANKSDDDVEYK